MLTVSRGNACLLQQGITREFSGGHFGVCAEFRVPSEILGYIRKNASINRERERQLKRKTEITGKARALGVGSNVDAA